MYAIPFALSLNINGGWDGLGRSLQSLESFRICTLRLTIVQWLGRYFVLKSLSGVLIGLFLWCVLGSITNIQFSPSVLGAVLVGEYALYAFLPVQSALNVLKYFNIFPIVLAVAQYLVLLYAIRLVMLMCVDFAVLLISHHSPSVQAAYLISAGILGVPALLTVLGIEVLKWVSPLVPVSSAELLWGLGSGSLIYALPWILWLACGFAALWLCRRRWIKGQ